MPPNGYESLCLNFAIGFFQSVAHGLGPLGFELDPGGDIPAQCLFLWVLWLNIGFALSVCLVVEGLLVSIDSVFISV